MSGVQRAMAAWHRYEVVEGPVATCPSRGLRRNPRHVVSTAATLDDARVLVVALAPGATIVDLQDGVVLA